MCLTVANLLNDRSSLGISPQGNTRPRGASAPAGHPILRSALVPCVVMVDVRFLMKVWNVVKKRTEFTPEKAGELCDSLIPTWGWRRRTYWFDAPPYKPPNKPTESQVRKFAEAEEFFEQIDLLDRTNVVRGYCKPSRFRLSHHHPPLFRANGTQESHVTRIEQKQVDVLLATEIVRVSTAGEAQAIILITGDADLVPAVSAAQTANCMVRLMVAEIPRVNPPIRSSPNLLRVVDERRDLVPILEVIGEHSSEEE